MAKGTDNGDFDYTYAITKGMIGVPISHYSLNNDNQVS